MSKKGEEWAMPIVLLVFVASAPFFLAPAATWAFLTSMTTWSWVERASWLVTIVGLVFALYQLRVLQADQKRVSDELTRRPKIVVGFDEPYVEGEGSGVRSQGVIRPEWDTSKSSSLETGLAVTVVNQGDKTARGIVCNFTFPTAVANLELRGGRGSVVRDLTGETRVVSETFNLNPSVVHRFLFAVQLKPVDAFTGLASVSLEDERPKDTQFRVVIATQPSEPLPHILTLEEIKAKLSEPSCHEARSLSE